MSRLAPAPESVPEACSANGPPAKGSQAMKTSSGERAGEKTVAQGGGSEKAAFHEAAYEEGVVASADGTTIGWSLVGLAARRS